MDKKIAKNRRTLKLFVQKTYKKSKSKIIGMIFGISILFSSTRSNSIRTTEPKNYTDSNSIMIRATPTRNNSSYGRLSQNKITYQKNEKITQTEKIYINSLIDSIEDKTFLVRGGDIDSFTMTLFKIILIFATGQNLNSSDSFKINSSVGHSNQLSVIKAPKQTPKLKYNQPLDRNRNNLRHLSCKKNPNQDGTLTPEMKRNLPHEEDIYIPEQNVIIRHKQLVYKMKKHGHDFEIESTRNSKGYFRTKASVENITAFKKEIKSLVIGGQRIEGTYNIDEPSGFKAIHFFDEKTGRNAIFKADTNQFVSAWKLFDDQIKDLKSNYNVGGIK